MFPFLKFPGVDTVLGPEMKSTGEVMGIDSDFGRAYAKSQIEAGNPIPASGRLFVSVRDEDQGRVAGPMREFAEAGFKLLATAGTAKMLEAAGLAVELVAKVGEGSPQRRGPHRGRRRGPGREHGRGRSALGARLVRDPPRGAPARPPVLHDLRGAARRRGRGARAPAGHDRRALAARGSPGRVAAGKGVAAMTTITGKPAVAANQGLYNGFLAAGLLWALLRYGVVGGRHILTFFLLCVLVAGCYGGATVHPRLAAVWRTRG